MLTVLLTVLHIAVCFVLIVVVLLQTGKRADLAGAFGGGGSQTAFGARGAATVLSRSTTIAAVLFMLTSLTLAILSSRGRTGSTVLDSVPPPPVQSQAPAQTPPVPTDAPSDAPAQPAPAQPEPNSPPPS
jgi:preprotein translocase subunit SecG